jgi:hypothetical protein
MPTIMCTKNMWRAIGGRDSLPPRQPPEIKGTRLGAWSMRELPTRAGLLAVGLEETTYLTVVCPLLGLPEFLLVFAASLEAVLTDLGVRPPVSEAEAHAIVRGAHFAKNDSRSLLGSVNDVAFHLSVRLEGEARITMPTLRKIQLELNRMPHVNRKPPFPDQAVRVLFDEASSV